MRHLYSLIFLISGSILLYVGYGQYLSGKNLIDQGGRGLGTVITNVAVDDEDGTMYKPRIKFESGGKMYEFTSEISSRPAAYRVGDRVEVLYPKGQPEQARINDFWSLWFLVLLLGIFGTVLFIIGAGRLWHGLLNTKNFSPKKQA